MSFDLKGIFNIDGRPAKKSVKEVEKEVQASAEKMTDYLQSAFSGNLGGKLFGTAFKAAGLGAIYELATSFSEKIAQSFKDIKIGALRTGLERETFQKVRNVTESEGSSPDTAARAMEHIAIAQEKIKNGEADSEKLLKTFSSLGVTLRDLESKSFQEIFFKIAEGMKDAELTGEKLAAIHELLGKTGAELIPSFRKGFAGPAAEGGVVGEDTLQAQDKLNSSMAESTAILKDYGETWKTVGRILFVEPISALKGLPILLKDIGSGDFFRKFSPEFRRQQEEQRQEDARLANLRKEQEEEIRKKDTERSKQQLAAKQEQMADQKAAEEAEKRATGANPQLEQQLFEKQRKNALAVLTPGQQKDELRKQIKDAQKDLTEASDFEELFPGFETGREDRIKKAARVANLQGELIDLAKRQPHEEGIRDSLARVGGGFQNDTGRTNSLLEEIRNSSQQTEELLREQTTTSDNPYGG